MGTSISEMSVERCHCIKWSQNFIKTLYPYHASCNSLNKAENHFASVKEKEKRKFMTSDQQINRKLKKLYTYVYLHKTTQWARRTSFLQFGKLYWP